jgi:hypothetical protein
VNFENSLAWELRLVKNEKLKMRRRKTFGSPKDVKGMVR